MPVQSPLSAYTETHMRTLDDIIPPSKRQAPPPSAPSAPPPRSRGRFPWVTAFIVLLIIAVCVGALFYFSSAEVKVVPTTATANVSGSFTASAGSDTLAFEVISAEKVATKSVESSGTRAVSSSASGKVTIYNTQSTAQRLITNTRFQSASGLIFRVHQAVTVPAAKSGTPGSITATVYADKPGSDYNVGPTSFTLPGLSGTPQYTQVTAKSSAPMAGGASGNEPVVDSSTESSTRSDLDASLASDLTSELASQIPAGYVLIPGSSVTTYSALPTAASATAGQADVKEQGDIRAVVFPSAELAKAIATNALAGSYQGEPITLADPSGLTLTSAGGIPAEGDQSFTFTLTGTAPLAYTVDPARIAAAVAGKTRDDAITILKSYPEVHQTSIILRPFWRSSFPEDPAQIKVSTSAPAAN